VRRAGMPGRAGVVLLHWFFVIVVVSVVVVETGKKKMGAGWRCRCVAQATHTRGSSQGGQSGEESLSGQALVPQTVPPVLQGRATAPGRFC
jgi:hypothetical protein